MNTTRQTKDIMDKKQLLINAIAHVVCGLMALGTGIAFQGTVFSPIGTMSVFVGGLFFGLSRGYIVSYFSAIKDNSDENRVE
jgi:hypothetical protein